MANARSQTRSDEQRTSPSQARSGPLSLRSVPMLLCVPLGIAAALTLMSAVLFESVAYPWLRSTWPNLDQAYAAAPLPPVFVAWKAISLIVAAIWLVASLLGLLVRRPFALWVVRKAYVSAYLFLAFYAFLVTNITGEVAAVIMAAPDPTPGKPVFGLFELFAWRCQWLWPAALLAALTVVLHILSWRRKTVNLYCRTKEDSPAAGDRVIENIRTHGRDPRYRKSVYGSSFAHLLVIVIIPLLLSLRSGCIRPYRVPKGSGEPAVAMLKVVQPKKKEKRKKYILSKNSAIVFEMPDLEDSELTKEVDKSTRDTYTADTSAAHGKLGTGGGNKAGWVDGFGDGEIRFIRIQYDGPEWNDGMDESQGADANFLAAFKRLSGLGSEQVARQGESHPISHLTKYPKGEAPPFVYMTGSSHIRLSAAEKKYLREYLKSGGMIFADAGSPRWDREFRSHANTLLPGHRLTPIADDDPIFQIPFGFPNGPPPLWFHGGKQAMGIKYHGRWAVFYFPGDLNDAWKTGHSGIDSDLAETAMHVGVNVVYYAVTRYLEATRKHRK